MGAPWIWISNIYFSKAAEIVLHFEEWVPVQFNIEISLAQHYVKSYWLIPLVIFFHPWTIPLTNYVQDITKMVTYGIKRSEIYVAFAVNTISHQILIHCTINFEVPLVQGDIECFVPFRGAKTNKSRKILHFLRHWTGKYILRHSGQMRMHLWTLVLCEICDVSAFENWQYRR